MTDYALEDFKYVGSELELFGEALNWKNYYSRLMKPFIHGHVLEVGAGIGANTPQLWNSKVTSWLCLEPDAALHAKIVNKIASNQMPVGCSSKNGFLSDLPTNNFFDTVLYVDVLEHIEDDKSELINAAAHLNAGGRLIVLSPSHDWLFSEFDTAVGHFRRYNRKSLNRISPPTMHLEKQFYLDSVGTIASLANRLILKKGHPNKSQIKVWDRFLVPASQILDPCLGRRFGKTIVSIWLKPGEGG